MSTVQLLARGKLNWTIDALGRRADGYHLVDMLMHSIDLADALTLRRTRGDICVRCDLPGVPEGEGNLAHRAARLLLETLRCAAGVDIHIKKRIPMGAGLGGGSADAAGALLGVNRLLGDPLPLARLCELGLRLGADVPFCLTGGLQRATGVGEVLLPLPCPPPLWVLLAKPPVELSTAAVYAALDAGGGARERPDTRGALAALRAGDAARLARCLGNALRLPALSLCEEMAPLERALGQTGGLAVSMTGSGCTLFALFADKAQAVNGLARLRAQRVDAWAQVVSTACRSMEWLP